MIDDNLTGEAAADAPLRAVLFQPAFNAADGQPAAVIITGPEADHEKLLIADLIFISGVVQRCITRFIVFFLFFGILFRRGGRRGGCKCG